MEIQATTRYVRMSPSKARDLARAIQGMSASQALAVTEFNARKAGFQIGKTLKSAIANAENNEGLSADDLFVGRAVVEEGPRLKRYQPKARGMAGRILKRTSHIKITLTDEAPAGK